MRLKLLHIGRLDLSTALSIIFIVSSFRFLTVSHFQSCKLRLFNISLKLLFPSILKCILNICFALVMRCVHLGIIRKRHISTQRVGLQAQLFSWWVRPDLESGLVFTTVCDADKAEMGSVWDI